MNSVHGPSFLASLITSIIESSSTVECFCEEKNNNNNRTLYCLPVCLSACLTFSYQFSSACCPGIHCEHTETITYRKNLLFVIPLKWDEDDFLLGMKNPSRIQETNLFSAEGLSVHTVRRWFRTTALFSVKFLERLLKY